MPCGKMGKKKDIHRKDISNSITSFATSNGLTIPCARADVSFALSAVSTGSGLNGNPRQTCDKPPTGPQS